jgi:hypothetical protein
MEQRVTFDEHGQRQLVMPVDPADAARRHTPEG